MRRSRRLDGLLVTACTGDDHPRRQARICYRHNSLSLLIDKGRVRVNDEKIDSQDLDIPFDTPMLVQVGKRSFVEVV